MRALIALALAAAAVVVRGDEAKVQEVLASECRPESGSCAGSATEETNALLQVASSSTFGCAWNDEDPHKPTNLGHCCLNLFRPLHKVKGRWRGRECSFKCMFCSGRGEDVNRFCGSGCDGCHPGGNEVLPCCPGLSAFREYDGRYICRLGISWGSSWDSSRGSGANATSCAGLDEDPRQAVAGHAGDEGSGECCEPLVAVTARWSSGDPQCATRCVMCSPEGEAMFRLGDDEGHANEGCEAKKGTHLGFAPCCPGLQESEEGGKRICRVTKLAEGADHGER